MKNNNKKAISLILCASMILAGCGRVDISKSENRYGIEWAVEEKIEEDMVADGADGDKLRIDLMDSPSIRYGENGDDIYVSGEVTIYENWDWDEDLEELMKKTGVTHDFDAVVKYDSNSKTFDAVSCRLSYYVSYEENAHYVLTFDDIYLSGYNGKIRGKIKNNGKNTYSFVKIKVELMDRKGNVIDSDWTYAVGSEGISPGASSSFSMYFTEDSNIEDYKITIMDYDVD